MHWALLVGPRGRDEHWLEMSLNDPSSLQMPPSFPMKAMFGLFGVAAITC